MVRRKWRLIKCFYSSSVEIAMTSIFFRAGHMGGGMAANLLAYVLAYDISDVRLLHGYRRPSPRCRCCCG